jgi:hypothetical protein
MAWAVSRVFLNETRRYEPRERADLVLSIDEDPYRTIFAALIWKWW